MRMRRACLLLVLILVCGVLSSCEPSLAEEREAIVTLLDARKTAMEQGDTGAYQKLISRDYHDAWGGRERVLEEIKTTFSGVKGVFVSYTRRKITVQGQNARVLQNYEMMVEEPELLLRGTDNLTLTKEDGQWRIISGLFQKARAKKKPQEPAPAP